MGHLLDCLDLILQCSNTLLSDLNKKVDKLAFTTPMNGYPKIIGLFAKNNHDTRDTVLKSEQCRPKTRFPSCQVETF